MISYEELIERINSYNSQLLNPNIPPHSSNLLHQLGRKDKKNLAFFNRICRQYFKMRTRGVDLSCNFEKYVMNLVDATNQYMDLCVGNKLFSHQSDFTSSIIPEMFFLIMYKIVKELKLGSDYIVSAQSEVPIECMFDLQNGGRMMFKTKRLDLLVSNNTSISLGSKSYPFVIPIIAMEMKTNLDKNMMSGIETSVAALKSTFPHCVYFVITEFCDLATDKLNYASSDIDEIYIIRNQKRSEVRKSGNTRNEISANLVLEVSSICKNQLNNAMKSVVSLEKRMANGKLI